ALGQCASTRAAWGAGARLCVRWRPPGGAYPPARPPPPSRGAPPRRKTPPQDSRQSQAVTCFVGVCRLAALGRPGQRRPEVIVLLLEPLQPLLFRPAQQCRLRPFRQFQEPVAMPAAHSIPLAGALQVLRAVFTDGFQETIARLSLLLVHYHQRLVDQLRQ